MRTGGAPLLRRCARDLLPHAGEGIGAPRIRQARHDRSLRPASQQTLAAIAAAHDEAALEAVRVAALGKKGSISALLATLGKMSPDERKTRRRGDQRAEGRGRRARSPSAARR